MKIKIILKEMRVHHYIKNLLIFVPLACSGQLFNIDKLIPAIFAFLAFCLISSAVYIINDINDAEKDKKHPFKCKRPIAAGQLSKKAACVAAAVLLAAGMALEALCFSLPTLLTLLLYLLLNISYSFGLKDIPLLDIAILVSGFLIRVIYGSLITEIAISSWLYLVIISTSFYFGFGKRRNELKRQTGNDTRSVIKKYPLSFLEKNMYVCMAIVFVFYALWTVDEKTIVLYQNSRLIWTVPFLMLIFMKYSLTIEGDSDADPVEVLLHDKVLIVLSTAYLAAMFALLYLIR